MAVSNTALQLEPYRGASPSARLTPLLFLALCLLLLAHLPLLATHASVLWIRPHYQFFPLALLGAAVLGMRGLQGAGPLVAGSSFVTFGLLLLDWLLLALGLLMESSWLGAVAFLIALVAVAHGLGGRTLLGRLFPALGMLALLIPPPLEMDRSLILALQTLTTRWSSRILDYLGIYHVMSGHVVEVAGRRLLVEEACSGVNSLFSTVACTLFLIFYLRLPPLRATLLLAAAGAWVLTLNVCRVVLLTYLVVRWNIDLTVGWQHEALGLALFSAGLGLIWSTNGFLLFLFSQKIPLPAAPAVVPETAATESGRPTWPPQLPAQIRGGWLASAVIAYGLLVLANLTLHGVGLTRERHASGQGPLLETLDANTLPLQLGPFTRKKESGFQIQSRSRSSEFGEFSRVWAYQVGRAEATFSLDYPFPYWHDLTRCYTGQGWSLGAQTVWPLGKAANGFMEVALTKPGYRSGTLLFAQVDRMGTLLEARPGGALLSTYRHGKVLADFWDRLQGKPANPSAEPAGPVFQVQLFIESYQPLTEADSHQAREFFIQSVNLVRRSFTTEEQAAIFCTNAN